MEQEDTTLHPYASLLQSLEENVFEVTKEGVVAHIWKVHNASLLVSNSSEFKISATLESLLPKAFFNEFLSVVHKTIENNTPQTFVSASPILHNRWIEMKLTNIDGEKVLVLAKDATRELRIKRQLERKVKELEKINNLMINREIRMRELKKKIRKLEQRSSSSLPASLYSDV